MLSLTEFVKKGNPNVLVILPGRGSRPWDMLEDFEPYFPDWDILGVTPDKEFYPFINLASQEKVVHSLSETIKVLRERLAEHTVGQNLVVTGHSAGAATTLSLFASGFPMKAAIINNGAWFANTKVSIPKESMLILAHTQNDQVFNWQERYLPMKACFEDCNLRTVETVKGGHYAVPLHMPTIMEHLNSHMATTVQP